MSISGALVRRFGMGESVLDVPPALAVRWNDLDPAIRDHVASYLALGEHDPDDHREPVAIGVAHVLPATFADDLTAGAPRLRAAFPRLVRCLASIEDGDPLTIRIACEGTQDGPFFGFMQATGRPARFHEVHELRLRRDRVAEDRVSIDVGAIIRQLGGAATITSAGRPGPGRPRR